MLLKNQYQVLPATRQEIQPIIEIWHYSKSINGVKGTYYFKLEDNGKIIGAIIFGRLAMAGQYRKYCEDESDIIELRRLACIDNTPQNTESFFISRCLRWLRQNTRIELIVSYADSNYGHSGTIYKASNFKHIGMTSRGRVITWNGKKYHDKTIRTKYKGKLKPFAQRVKDALESGQAKYVSQEGKHVYLYKLR